MKHFRSYSLLAFCFFSLISLVWATGPDLLSEWMEVSPFIALPDSDTTRTSLPYPFFDRWSDPYNSPPPSSPLYLSQPSNIQTRVEYNPEERQYDIFEKVGDGFFRNPSYMTFEEFKEAEFAKSTKGYWKQKANADNISQKRGFAPRLYVGGEAFNRIFGGNTIDIRPQGSASLAFGLNISRYDNPTLPERQRKITTFDFREQIQMNVIGNIGEKLKITTNYNTQASFDFENQMKLEYTGYEDEIIQKIEAGNVSLPLNSQLIQGSQSLFGLKTQLKFGRLTVTSLLSQQRGQASNIEVKGGATTTKFDIPCDQYEVNRHYFMGGYFKDQYDVALSDLPFINSLVAITRLEVWVTNRNNTTDNTRTILAMMDLGESAPFNQSIGSGSLSGPYPDNSCNSLYDTVGTSFLNSSQNLRDVNSVQNEMATFPQFSASRDYEVVQNARRLQPTEYSFNPRLGYISLNQALNGNEVLAVAYEYTVGGKVYRVGDLTNTGVEPPKVLFLKLVKARINNTQLPTWDLMMKNVYALGGFQIDKKDFKMDVLYYVDTIGNRLNYIPTTPSQPNVYAKALNRLFNLDKLNQNNDPRPDGEFDFIEGVTINSASGRIIFPVREPFGSYLRSKFTDSLAAQPYAYDALYDSTRIFAIQQAEKNKFSLKGSYVSKFGSDIPLNAINIPQGSVKVTAGGAPLVENVDYTVDYNLGRVKIINQGILNSGTAINISLESNSLFSIQSKTLFGSRFDYTVNKDLVLGGTLLRLNERPITQKVNIGDEPIANTIWGVDGTWKRESRWLTKMIDKLPGISTKDPSNITISGEFANLVPGNNKAIGKNGTAYVDDFEGSQSTIDLRNVGSWVMASTPSSIRPEADSVTLAYGKNRARFNWYIIDPLFYRNIQGVTPPNIDDNAISNNLVRQVPEKEIFPNRDAPQGQTVVLPVFNVSFYPEERGPYNYDVLPSSISAGVAPDGRLLNPASRWGGIMRRVETTDFDVANVEFIQFWMMDPFNSNTQNVGGTGGDLYFNLGNVSEDVLKDGKLEYENGLPVDGDTSRASRTTWGFTPKTQPPIIYAFDNNPDARQYQDVGFDGLKNNLESSFFQDYLDQLQANVTSQVYQAAASDPSSDNYHYYRGSDFDSQSLDILERYKKFSNPEGNSPTDNQSPENYPTASTTLPDVADVNKDFNQETSEQFYQYRVSLRPGEMNVGQNFIVDKVTRTVNLPNGSSDQVTWYQFKIPIREVAGTNPNITRVGDIQGFNTISFIRMFMSGFEEPMTLRFARLELLRGEWRKYAYDMRSTGDVIGTDPNNATFDIAVVNIEENGKRTPTNYVIPPGITQEVNIGSTVLQRLNEQSLSLKVCNLEDGDARAAFKNLDLDLRLYEKIKMFIHAEATGDEDALKNGDLSAFIRLGNDFNENYYEYEVPLTVTAWGSTSPEAIWPTANNIELELEKLVDMKLRRNNAVDNSGGAINITGVYSEQESGTNRKFSIRGNPSISSVRSIMIGIRNPKRDQNTGGADDGQAKCGEVWVNELRLTDFSKKGGWAANARMNAKLADIGNVTVAGQHKSAGFGPLEQKVSERPVTSETTFNVTSSLYLGKFLPESANLDIPMYVNYGTVVRNPQYDPLDQDVLFTKALDNADSKAERREIKRRSQDYTQTKGINFTNVKKNKGGGSTKSRLYDIENFNFTYGYDEVFHRDINIEYDVVKTHRGSVGYNFNTTPKYIAPFSKSKSMNSNYLKLIKEVNLNLVPTSLNFRYDITRMYGEKLFRNNTGYSDIIRDTFFNKNFEMRRLYDFKLDLTRSIKLDFNANNYSVVDEPEGRIDTDEDRDSIRSNIWGKNYLLGRNKNYTHQGNVSYQVPLNKFPLTDWISLNARYGFNYSWNAGQFLRNNQGQFTTDPRTGNTIQNSNTKQLNGNFTLTTLYNKVPLLKKLNSPKPKPAPKGKKEVKKEEPANPLKNPADAKAEQDTVKKKKPVKPLESMNGVRFLGKMIMGVRTLGFTYSENMGTSLPGYVNYSDLLGQDLNAGAPGIGFTAGSQRDIRQQAIRGGWITSDTSLNNPLARTYSSNFSGRSSIEPISGLKIELTATRQFSRNNSEYFRYNGTTFESQGITETGNFSVSIIAWNTAFVKDDKNTYSSQTFDNFNSYRKILSERLASENPNSTGFASPDTFGVVYNDGYTGLQQEVLALAFLSAYTGQSPNSVELNTFPKIPLPNWRITYDGLSKLPLFKKIFNSFNLTHSYRATYNVNSFQRNVAYKDAEFPVTRDISGNFVPRRELAQISMSEQFGPLLGVDVTWKNNMQTRAEFRRDRNISLTYAGVQITEVKGNEIVLGFGYRLPKFKLPFGIGGARKVGSNSLNLTADFSARRNITIIRRLQEGVNQPTAGLNVYSIKGAADYAVNERLNLRLFYEQTINTPVISTSFPTSNILTGVEVRFSLSQ